MTDDMRPRFEVRFETDAFPTDDLRVRRLDGSEGVSKLFAFDVELLSLHREAIDLDQASGAAASIVLEREGVEVRRIHGMIAEVDDLLASHKNFRGYRVRLVPRAYRLTLIQTQDIFMDLSVPEIILLKCALVGLAEDVSMRLAADYPKRDLVVQYGETDFAFLSRLAEHIGLSYFFEHDDGRDVLVFTDHQDGFPVAARKELPFRARGEDRDVFALRHERRLVPGYYAVRDYNDAIPHIDLTAEHELNDGFPGGVIEQGGNIKTPHESNAIVRARAEERRAQRDVFVGESELAEVVAGARATLSGHPDLGDAALLFIGVEHHAKLVVAGTGDVGQPSYQNTFRAAPAGRAYRPPRVTPKPKIAGFLTGFIDPGENEATRYAELDDEGRYLVRFVFDTTPKGDRPASIRIRMLQNHVGEGYGTHLPLKPGTEVLIAFVEGDPDRPVIVGALHNPLKPTPVSKRNAGTHRIMTGSGIKIDIVDEW